MGIATSSPIGQQAEGRRQVPTVAGQGVLHPRRPGRVGGRDDDPLPLKAPEAIGQDVRRKARELVAQLSEAPAAHEQGVDEEQTPAVADPIEGRFERCPRRRRIGLGGFAHVFHGRPTPGLHGIHVRSMLQVASNKPPTHA